jgi:hypothetical protein
MQKGAVNVAGEWTGGLQEPNGLKRQPLGLATTGATENHEGQPMSLHDEAGVRNLCMDRERRSVRIAAAARARSPLITDWVYRMRYAADRVRVDRRSALPGAEPAAYRTEGASWEHGNLDRSAGPAKPGKLPRPATSPARGRASVVVRARESRAHGDGRQ